MPYEHITVSSVGVLGHVLYLDGPSEIKVFKRVQVLPKLFLVARYCCMSLTLCRGRLVELVMRSLVRDWVNSH